MCSRHHPVKETACITLVSDNLTTHSTIALHPSDTGVHESEAALVRHEECRSFCGGMVAGESGLFWDESMPCCQNSTHTSSLSCLCLSRLHHHQTDPYGAQSTQEAQVIVIPSTYKTTYATLCTIHATSNASQSRSISARSLLSFCASLSSLFMCFTLSSRASL